MMKKKKTFNFLLLDLLIWFFFVIIVLLLFTIGLVFFFFTRIIICFGSFEVCGFVFVLFDKHASYLFGETFDNMTHLLSPRKCVLYLKIANGLNTFSAKKTRRFVGGCWSDSFEGNAERGNSDFLTLIKVKWSYTV